MPARPNSSSQVYFEGDFWNCIATSTAGQSPTAKPAQWSRISIPSTWRTVLAQYALARLLEGDGNSDKAVIVRAKADSMLNDMRETVAHSRGRRPTLQVTTR